MKDQILQLRSEGKTYNEIVKILGCSKSTVSYHCGAGVKDKQHLRQNQKTGNSLISHKLDKFKSPKRDDNSRLIKRSMKQKVDRFHRDRVIQSAPDYKNGWKYQGKYQSRTFNYQDILDKFGRYTKCYLTGRAIDLFEPNSYVFDHIVPISKSGNNTLDNLGVACKEANSAKHDLMLPEFLKLCAEILSNNSYCVNKVAGTGLEPV